MYYVGIDLGGTNIAAGLTNKKGEIIRKKSIPTHRDRPYTEIVKDMAGITIKLINEVGIDQKELKYIGIGSPGTPNVQEGTIIYSNNLNFRNAPIKYEMQKYINVPIYVENDANCAALAESVYGSAKGVDHSVTLTFGTGIGAGIVINKRIYSGFNNAASELGHTVIVSEGCQCSCGRKGCWETYASANALIRQTQEVLEQNLDSWIYTLVNGDLSKINGKTIFDAARKDDRLALNIVDTYIGYMSEGITNVINMLQPEIVVVGGGICNEGEYLLKPLREKVYQAMYTKDEVPKTQIKKAQMGNDAGIIGAAMLGEM